MVLKNPKGNGPFGLASFANIKIFLFSAILGPAAFCLSDLVFRQSELTSRPSGSEGIDIYTCNKQVLWESAGAFFRVTTLSLHAASRTVHAFVV